MTTATNQEIEAFLSRWKDGSQSENTNHKGGRERANLQMFITELCSLLRLSSPDKALSDNSLNAYTFERGVVERFHDGGQSSRSIDLYKRGCFVLEGKDTGKKGESKSWESGIARALNQAQAYARSLPIDEGRPPFIIVVDVGKYFVLYSEFTQSGSSYIAFPDSRSHRIPLASLRNPETRELLRTIWLDPLKLDPTRNAGKVTRAVADKLAALAKSLEQDGQPPEKVASFLMRCLFTMFAEDVGLLPERGFTNLLESCKASPDTFHFQLESLWAIMNRGGFSPALNAKVMQFNGGLYADASAIQLQAQQIDLLIGAARSDWRYVEPAIFGTLLERALNPNERHKLGAHYTPRAYVERLVLPTLIEPLRAEWSNVQATVEVYRNKRKIKDAITELQGFLLRLCNIRVLDPACGSGNFLYVAMEHMKRLEGEVLELLGSIKKSMSFDVEGLTVDPHQFLGIEINPRAAKVAEMVLWIGYLQWHFRTYGNVNPPEPVLRDFHNIENRDALIAYDAVELVRDETGKPITRWDGITTRTSPITGDQVPDESAQVEQYIYRNPRKAEWPQADYIVGNPPFIGAATMRRALGDGYVDAVRSTWNEVPESADFVMYWWHIAAGKVRTGQVNQFGFITTNSIRQTFNRRIVQQNLEAKEPLSLVFAIPDHPWVDAADGAAVRIAMTVGSAGTNSGRLLLVRNEYATDQDEVGIDLQESKGVLFADLKTGANVAGANVLNSNSLMSQEGMKLHGEGFIVTKEEALGLGLGSIPDAERHLRHFKNGRDLADKPRNLMVIDLFGLGIEQVRAKFPAMYQWLHERVKPDRDAKAHTKDGAAYAKSWWIFGKPRQELRKQLIDLKRYIATVKTAKHRVFQFLDSEVLPESKLIAFGLSDAFFHGILSSRLHVLWSFTSGSWLGVGNDSTYVKGRCFECFPFPDATEDQKSRIRDLAEELDAHRKHQQAQHPELTLTGMYNVLEKLRSGDALNAKEKVIHEQGLVSILRELHDELDRAVFAAYGWDDLADKLLGMPGATTPLPDKSDAQTEAEEELLKRLVALNHERAAEEARGLVRWLRPEYQNPDASPQPVQQEADLTEEDQVATILTVGKQSWPKGIRDQIVVVRNALGNQPVSPAAIASNFKDAKRILPAIEDALLALEDLGMAHQENGEYRSI